MAEYALTTEEVRNYFVHAVIEHSYHSWAGEAAGKDFDRWLASVKAEAWDEGFSAGWAECSDPDPFVNDVWDAKTRNPYRKTND